MSHHTCSLFIAAVAPLFVACGASDGAEPAETSQTGRFSTTPGEPNHEEITATALSFLRPDALFTIVVGNISTDVEFFLVNANHFDDCNFTGGSRVVADNQAEAVRQLSPSNTAQDAEARAGVAFSRSLHALQDFYAHSNWVELGGESLVDTGLGAFPSLTPYSTVPSSGFVVVQGPNPKQSALNRKTDQPYPTNAVVSYRDRGKPRPALISGTVDYEAGDFCPHNVAMTHDELNKDKSTNVGREAGYEAAKSLAIAQTRHEWCRFKALTQAAWGAAGTARMEGWVAPGAQEPDCTVE